MTARHPTSDRHLRRAVSQLLQQIATLRTSRDHWMKLAKSSQRLTNSQRQHDRCRAKEETKRLDFVIKNQAFILDDAEGHQLYIQDEDENYIPLSGSGHFSTPRAAIDEARRRVGDAP